MRQAFIVNSFADAYKKLLKNTLFIYLDSHWFISRDSDSTDLYVIRIKDGHEDIEYNIQNFGENFEVVTDNEQVAKLLFWVHKLFNAIESQKLDLFNEGNKVDLDLFSEWRFIDDITLDNDGTFKVKLT